MSRGARARDFDSLEPRERKRDDRPRHYRPEGHNTRKPHQQNYAKARREKELTVKNDRFYSGGSTGAVGGNITWMRPRPRAAPRGRPVVVEKPKPRGRSASPQRRSPSPDEANPEEQEDTEPIEPKRPTSDNAFSALKPVGSDDVEMLEAVKAKPKPAAKRRFLEDESKDYKLPVGEVLCDELDLRAKEEARRLLALESVPVIRDEIESLLLRPLSAPSSPPSILFIRMVLAHFPTETLSALQVLSGHRIAPSGHFWTEILGGDVVNSAALRELLHQRRLLLSSYLASRHPDATPAQRSEPATILAAATIPAFSPAGDLTPALRVARLNKDEKAHPTVMRATSSFVDEIRRNPGRRSAVPCAELFKMAFDEFTSGLFRHFDWSHASVIGSAPLACMMPPPRRLLYEFVRVRRVRRLVSRLPLPADVTRMIAEYAQLEQHLRTELHAWYHGPKSPWCTADVDVFIMADTAEEGKQRIEQAYMQIASALPRNSEHLVVRTPNSLTIVSPVRGQRNVQLLLGLGRSPIDFTLFCDLDATAMAYNGANVLVLPRAAHALNTRSNFVAPSALQNPAARSRIVKYAHRGFDAIVFELCKHWPRCDMGAALDADRKGAMFLADMRRRIARGNFVETRLGEPAAPEMGYDDAHVPVGQPLSIVLEFAAEHNLGVSAPSFVPQPLTELLADAYAIHGTPTTLRGVRDRLHDVLSSHRSDEFLLKCYQCNRRTPYDAQHPERSGLGLCSDCTALNVAKLSQWDRISGQGKVAIVTGARVKIGYQICLRLLRSGFSVVALTRFPNDAARRYAAEPDFVAWRDRLHIYGVDLRHLPSVHTFIEAVKRRFQRLDVLVNNAAQTVRRPRAYYRPLVDFERSAAVGLLPAAAEWRPLLANASPLLTQEVGATDPKSALSVAGGAGSLLAMAAPHSALIPAFAAQAPLSAALTQVPLLPCDAAERDEANFPSDRFDEHGEPADLRDETSWTARVADVSPVEALETQIVNSTVPLMLMQSFLPLLTASRGASASFVVNVSSAEGQFDSSVKKEGTHVHTNMAKAALNMMVRTLAAEMQRQRVFISAVDTGWVTRMRPVVKSKWKRPTPAPLSDKDGAARVLDPIARGLLGLGAPTGVLLRNYETVPW